MVEPVQGGKIGGMEIPEELTRDYICACHRECRIYYRPDPGVAAVAFVQHPNCPSTNPTSVPVPGFRWFEEKNDDGQWVRLSP
jgi:hypothetical protein